ncbi:CrcB-like protein-domain-containing protein [Xylariales sp. AK1849]|nr:CrcB-like protein-domain-containing protein [Xylariales sp. AK1849]
MTQNLELGERTTTSVRNGQQRRPSASRVDYDVPDSYANEPDSQLGTGPVENPDETALYEHHSLEESRSHDPEYCRNRREQRRASQSDIEPAAPAPPSGKKHGHNIGDLHTTSRLATELYSISYLILFSIFGTLARLGLQALTYYPGAPIPFTSVWPNFAGSLVMGFLAEDRKLFRDEWGTPSYEQQINQARQNANDEESGESGAPKAKVDLAAAKKAHMAAKKTIPLYIGLATGFCGSFTSFSSFIRDVFLALSNDMQTPELGSSTVSRSGGYSFMALVAVILTTVSLSLAGLFTGAHVAIAMEPITPAIPILPMRRFVDPICVFIAWGCWVGAVLLSVFPPDRWANPGAAETWRGRATLALVLAPLGCLGRFYASLHLNGRVASFPLGTFAVNIFGTAVLGMAWDIAHVPAGGVIGCQVLQGIEDGFCGCLTTVSTWVSELATLRRRHAYIYGVTSVVVALAFMVAIMGALRWSEGFSGLVCLH